MYQAKPYEKGFKGKASQFYEGSQCTLWIYISAKRFRQQVEVQVVFGQ